MIIGFKKKKSESLVLIHQEKQIGDDWFVTFQLMQNDSPVAVDSWPASKHRGADWLLDSIKMKDLLGSQVSEAAVEVSFDNLMNKFAEQEGYLQRLLEFPPLFDGGIHLESHGLLHSEDYSLSYHWLNGSGRQIVQSERKEGFLFVGDRKHLLPVHAWKMAKQLDAIKSSMEKTTTADARLRVLEGFKSLRDLLPEEERGRFSESSDISNLKLFYSNAFRLEAVPESNGYKIRPVLLRRKEDKDGASVVFESILPPSEQNKYADSFSNSTKLLPYYNLGVGKYLLIGEQLNKALSVVHKVQHASAEERLKFLRNPKAAIAESLDGVIDEEELNNIFSDRVIGIGEWNAKVIPWMQLPPGDWIPEYELPDVPKGIDIGGLKIQLTTNEAKALLTKVEEAQKSGTPFVTHSGVQIPVNDTARSALAAIVPRTPEPKPQGEKIEEPKAENSSQNSIMLVKENLESVEFAVHRVPRTMFPSERGIPNAVRTTPKPHQEEAFNWLCEHYKAGSRGVLLADDMGLGKTFQSLMFFSWLREGIESGELHEKPLLIVAPTGLLKNWEAEIERHLLRDLGHLVRVFGSELKTIRSGQSLNTQKLRNAGLVLTTYDTLTRYQTSFGAVSQSIVMRGKSKTVRVIETEHYLK